MGKHLYLTKPMFFTLQFPGEKNIEAAKHQHKWSLFTQLMVMGQIINELMLGFKAKCPVSGTKTGIQSVNEVVQNTFYSDSEFKSPVSVAKRLMLCHVVK